MRTYIKVPIKIITPKLAQNKQDSIFYAGKNIAEVKVQNKTYVLTTAGEYRFQITKKGQPFTCYIDSNGESFGHTTSVRLKLTPASVKALNFSNWGWFGINVWGKEPTIIQTQPGDFSIKLQKKCLEYPTEVWSEYDEALSAFIEYVEKDLSR
jgi:hypothetical protein